MWVPCYRANIYQIQRQGWLVEGIATYYGGPDYFSKEELVFLCKERNIALNKLHIGNPLEIDKSEIKIKYTLFRYFIEYLIKTYGIKKFQAFLYSYLENPHEYKEHFISTFSDDLNLILQNFENFLRLTIVWTEQFST